MKDDEHQLLILW